MTADSRVPAGPPISDKAKLLLLNHAMAVVTGFDGAMARQAHREFCDYIASLEAVAALRAAGDDEPMRGDWICDKCGFVESRRQVSAISGAVRAVPVADNPRCPNDGEPLRVQTWKEFAKLLMTLIDQQRDDIISLRAAGDPEDTRRLDWIAENAEVIRSRHEPSTSVWDDVPMMGKLIWDSDDTRTPLREAIDRARVSRPTERP